MSSWIRRFHGVGGPVRLVFLPHAGGAASFYTPYSAALSGKADVLCVQYPGRHDRLSEPAIDNVAELADAVRSALPLDLPTVLFGHSLGASVAFEVARMLERDSDVVPMGLLVSGRRSPNIAGGGEVHRRDDAGILAELKTLSGTDPRVLNEPELLRMILPMIRTDYRAAETYEYQPGPPLSCPITALVGNSDPRVRVDDVRGWAEFTTGPFELEVFPGGHFFLADQRDGVIDVVTRQLAG